jgi:hypothetical protein
MSADAMNDPPVMETSQKEKLSTVTDIAKWREPIESIPKIGITIVGVAYVIGLLILNIHIGKFGVYYLGFFQVEYVMTGALWSFLSGITFFVCHLVKSQVEGIINQYKAEKKGVKLLPLLILQAMITLIGAPMSLVYVLIILSGNKLSPFSLSFWLALGVLFINLGAILAVVLKVKKIYKYFIRRSESVQEEKMTKYQGFVDIFHNIIVFVLALGLYATYVFPELSPAYGGGKKQLAEFVIKADQKETIKTIGIETSNDDRRFGPVEVLFESPDFILIFPPKGFKNENVKAIRINKSLIDASYYLSSK